MYRFAHNDRIMRGHEFLGDRASRDAWKPAGIPDMGYHLGRAKPVDARTVTENGGEAA